MPNLAQRLRKPGGPVTQRDRLLAAELLESVEETMRIGASGALDSWGEGAVRWAQGWCAKFDGGAA
jgi:hypothetical protein